MRKTTTKRALATIILAASGFWGSSAFAQSYMNVTVGGQFSPGVFGQISIGSAPPPPVVNVQPVIVGRPIVGAPVVYMHVPEDERRDWRHACRRYGACGRPVQFVRVEDNNRWWEHREEMRHEQRDERWDDRRDERGYDRRDDRREFHHDNGRRGGPDWRERGDERR